jgi:hypothetical protein
LSVLQQEARDMRSKFGVRVAIVAVVALGVLLFGSAVATADANAKKRTLRLEATQNQSEFVDVGAPGPSLGDQFVASETLFRRGEEVGTSGIVCTATEVVPPYDVITFHCVATLDLERGQITLQGMIEVQGEDDSGPFTVAITGGTGAYRGAGGEARIRNVSETESIYRLTFEPKHKHKGH